LEECLVRSKVSVRSHRVVARRGLPPAACEKLESRRLLSASPAQESGGSLSETFLTSLPSAVLPGSRGTVGLRIENSGPGTAAGNFQLTLLASTDGTTAGAVETVKNITGTLDLPIKGHRDAAINFVYPSDLVAGTYKFVAVVSFDGTTTQTTEPYEQTVIAPAFVNLSAYFTQVPAFITIGHAPVTGLAVLLSNTGNVAARGDITINLYESPTQTLDASSILLQTFSPVQIDIAANGTRTLMLTQKQVPLSASTGDEFLIASLSSTTTVQDANSANSTIVAPFPTSFTTAQFTSVPENVTVGKTASVSLLVNNAEGAPVHGDVDISLYESPTPSLGSSASLLETFSNLPLNMPTNGAKTYNLSLQVPLTAELGTQFLVATLAPVPPLAATQTTQSTIVPQEGTMFIEPATTF
jgi:hypothetical protein